MQLNKNTYLQAEYLKCEASGKGATDCIKLFPVNSVKYNHCLTNKVHYFVNLAQREFKKRKLTSSPVILLPRNQAIVNVKPPEVLRNICQLYPRKKPNGCTDPTPAPDNKSGNDNNNQKLDTNNSNPDNGTSTTVKTEDSSSTSETPEQTEESSTENSEASKDSQTDEDRTKT
ncbi:unnamed protein product [Danaus chrysippus]|uniref:(African queen) hypothetical protein n=1 Tax=Danaus chrysippus TaxID=151541 RepID=A0A8J2QNB2_9NEOP|nr:unnamed protein product [Danaus chrysippus]